MTKFSWLPLACAFVSASLLPGQEVMSTSMVSGGFSASATFAPPRALGPPITGAPYCADSVSEFQQTLADGTHISQTTTEHHTCRDSAGRSRTERLLFHGPRPTTARQGGNIQVIEIRDPVGGYQYTLDTRNKIAHRVVLPTLSNRPRLMRNDNASVSAPATPAIARRVTPPVPDNSPEAALRPQFSTESLGTQTINGVLAQGTRNTTIYPVNSEGNDRPITETNETWMSPDLKLMVLSKNSDPRHGDRINRLDNVTTTEPDPTLFQPPSDYQVVDESGTFKINYSQQ